jgi:hypothetical protein
MIALAVEILFWVCLAAFLAIAAWHAFISNESQDQ